MSEPTTTPGTVGAIHDIGYRHYDGPRLGASYIRRSLFVDTVRGAFGLGRSARSKIMPFLLLGVMILPAVVMGIVTGYFGFDALPVRYTEYPILLQVDVTIFLGAQAPAVMSRDLRFRVAPLQLPRDRNRRKQVPPAAAAGKDVGVHRREVYGRKFEIRISKSESRPTALPSE